MKKISMFIIMLAMLIAALPTAAFAGVTTACLILSTRIIFKTASMRPKFSDADRLQATAIRFSTRRIFTSAQRAGAAPKSGLLDNDTPTFWAVMGDLDNGSFTNDAAGATARAVANHYTLYVFPTRTGNQIGLGNDRQADIVDLSGGYFSTIRWGFGCTFGLATRPPLSTHATDKKMLADLQNKNGLALDGTPIIRTLSELNNLLSKGFAAKRLRNADGSEGPMSGICPVIKDPTNGGIAPADTLAFVKKADGTPLEPQSSSSSRR